MATDNQPFHSPTYFGCFDLLTSQVAQALPFQFTGGTVINDAQVVVTYRDNPVKVYTVGDGLTISNNNADITLEINGVDFERYAGNTLMAHCSFFAVGSIEITFELEIKESPLS